MSHGVKRLLVHFSVLLLKTEERVWVFQKHKLLHKQLDSLAVSWKKNPASLSMEYPSLSSLISQTQVQPSQQIDRSDISISC